MVRIGESVTLQSENRERSWKITGIDIYGRVKCYTMEWSPKFGPALDLRLTQNEMEMNGVQPA